MLCAIPMEIANRELDGVIYLAMHLAKQGLPTLFGERMVNEYVFRLNPGKPVIYFDQDQNVDVNQRILDDGGVVINLNAEGQNLDLYPQLLNMFAKASPSFSAMFVRGEVQKEALLSVFPESKKECVIASGHPSFDLLDKRYNAFHEENWIVAQYGRDYIQVNTQFVTFNHKMGFEHYLKMISTLDEWRDVYTDEDFLAEVERQRVFEGKVVHAFIEMVKQLAQAYPDRQIILRPHPMENRQFYQESLSGISNVAIEPNRPVRAWIASASVVIHHSCTTGVESLLLGKNVIRFDPVEWEISKNMQTSAGVRAATIEQVIDLVGNAEIGAGVRTSQIESMRSHMANCGGEQASPLIAKHAAALSDGQKAWIPEKLNIWESTKCWRKYLSKVLRAQQPGRVGKKVRYALEKFPRLPFSEVVKVVNNLKDVDSTLPDVELVNLGLNVYLMKPVD